MRSVVAIMLSTLRLSIPCFLSTSGHALDQFTGRCARVLFLVLLIIPLAPAQADDIDAKRERLQNINQQLEQQSRELEQQKSRAALMEKKVECNWNLLQSYQRCQEELDRTLEEQLSCTGEAKLVYKQCMEGIEQ